MPTKRTRRHFLLKKLEENKKYRMILTRRIAHMNYNQEAKKENHQHVYREEYKRKEKKNVEENKK